jgi:hypothetical protein
MDSQPKTNVNAALESDDFGAASHPISDRDSPIARGADSGLQQLGALNTDSGLFELGSPNRNRLARISDAQCSARFDDRRTSWTDSGLPGAFPSGAYSGLLTVARHHNASRHDGIGEAHQSGGATELAGRTELS